MTTYVFLEILLPLVAITTVLIGIALYYLCCYDKKSRKAKSSRKRNSRRKRSRSSRMRNSRRKRGRYPDGHQAQDTTSDEDPEELDTQTAKHTEAMEQVDTNQVIVAMPDDEPPPPYHSDPPPDYPGEQETDVPIEDNTA